jgi:hypothetical protein
MWLSAEDTAWRRALRGLKGYASDLTAIVTVADDGGSSGLWRREMGLLRRAICVTASPPGRRRTADGATLAIRFAA